MKPVSYIKLSSTLLNSFFDGVLISTSMDIRTDPVMKFDFFLTVHHSKDLFPVTNLIHNLFIL